MDHFLIEHVPQLSDPSEQALLRDHGADLAASYILMAAPRMKNPSFSAGEEWRLIAYEPKNTDTSRRASTLPTHFRQVAGRVVPYKEVAFDQLPALEVILGFAMPIQADDEGLAVLMEETVGRVLPISRSRVPVRA